MLTFPIPDDGSEELEVMLFDVLVPFDGELDGAMFGTDELADPLV